MTCPRLIPALLMALCPPAVAAPRFGVMTDVGVPDGANISLVLRPVRALRISGGMGHNLVTRGLRAEVAWTPFASWLSPTLAVDYGSYPPGDANPIARSLKGDPMYSSRALDQFGYSYANARVGLAFGRTWMTFYIDAGITRVHGPLRGLDSSESESDTSVSFPTDPTATLWTASARLGFIFYLAK